MRSYRRVGHALRMAWYPLEPIDVSFFDTAPQRYVYRLDVAVAPEEVWRSLQSDESLARGGPR